MDVTPEHITTLYRRDSQAILLHFQRHVRDAELATDLLAETFAVAVERAGDFDGRNADGLVPWVWRIADEQLELARTRDLEHTEHPSTLRRRALRDDEVERIEELAETRALALQADRYLGELPDAQAQAVRLRVMDELGYDQVAERLGISEPTARARVSRALRTLQQRHDGQAEPS